MAIPVHLQGFKAAGIYRVVFDKSTILNLDTEILRLVAGYSEQGPFNTPVYVKDPQEFKMLFGDISKRLEKRGIYFHRLALQMLTAGPILCLNLKKFDGETVDGASISSDFDPKFEPIDTVKLNVEDIYDTSRFWELNADKLNDLRAVDGSVLDQYINICTTNTKKTSATYFIRKASGLKVSQYNITVNSWYSDGIEPMPEYLENQKQNLISDYFAEIYVFNGKFTAKQVLASETLKNYFIVYKDENGNDAIKLKSVIYNAFGDPIDTLDALYEDETSGALGHYVGSLIPYFKDKQGNYVNLDILFNSDQAVHNMMMSFNVDLLEEAGTGNIDLSGRLSIPVKKTKGLSIDDIYAGTAVTTVLGNNNSPVVSDIINFESNVYNNSLAINEFRYTKSKVSGTLYVKYVGETTITLEQVGSDENVSFNGVKDEIIKCAKKLGVIFDENNAPIAGKGTYWPESLGEPFVDVNNPLNGPVKVITMVSRIEQSGNDEVYTDLEQDMKVTFYNVEPRTKIRFNTPNGENAVYGSSVSFINYNDENWEWKESVMINNISTPAFICTEEYDNSLLTVLQPGDCLLAADATNDKDMDEEFPNDPDDKDGFYDNVYVQEVGTEYDENGNFLFNYIAVTGEPFKYDYCTAENEDEYKTYTADVYDNKGNLIHAAGDPIFDYTEQNGVTYIIADTYKKDVEDQDGNIVHKAGDVKRDIDDEQQPVYSVYNEPIIVVATGEIIPAGTSTDILPKKESFFEQDGVLNYNLVRIDAPLNQEIGNMVPQYLEGYVYKNERPQGTGMMAKAKWQDFILSALTDYKGLRTALLNKSEVDYRYVIDTFESFPVQNLKSVLSYLCKEKQSAFCIANFPSVQTFIKCPYTSFTDEKGLFNVDYVVAGYNKKKVATVRFSIPADMDGASFMAFYTPLKFSDGYLDMIVPSAGLVSNLFIQKYLSRQPYYIVAGPNYGLMNASGLVGPDYKYSMAELQVIEPFGVNCMVYRPNFGTFINANQTAKQIPVSALSKVNVRELVIYLQDEIEKVLQSYQWEFNNPITRNAILDKANSICELIKANGGIQAYKNIMDESNNTPEIIDNEMAVLSTHIEPGMGCGKMVHELTLYRTGQMSSYIAD